MREQFQLNQIEKRYLREVEVQARFGIGVRQLRNLRMQGGGPPWKKISGSVGRSGGRVLYDALGIQKWIEARPGGGDWIEKDSQVFAGARKERGR